MMLDPMPSKLGRKVRRLVGEEKEDSDD